jgi:hypothetical protein
MSLHTIPASHPHPQDTMSHLPSKVLSAFGDRITQDTPLLDSCDVSKMIGRCHGTTLLRAFHGTTHDFTRFSAALRGNPEGAFGKVNYFSTSYEDAERNYTGDGIDLKQRIEHQSEKLADEIESTPTDYGLPDDIDANAALTLATSLVREELIGTAPQVKECYLCVTKPFLVEGVSRKQYSLRPISSHNSPDLFPEAAETHAEAEEEVLAEHGLQDLVDEARDEAIQDLEDEIYERSSEKQDGFYERLTEAFASVAASYDVPTPDLPKSIELISELTHQEFHDAFKSDESLTLIDCPESGAAISGDFFAKVIEALGFDAIILTHADRAFPDMGIPPAAAHIHIFDSCAANIIEVSATPILAPSTNTNPQIAA